MSTIMTIRVFDHSGRWLFVRDYTPDGYAGRGHVNLTPHADDAKRFPTPGDAFKFYRQVSTTHPRRADGKPNRPLTSYTIELVPVDALGAPCIYCGKHHPGMVICP